MPKIIKQTKLETVFFLPNQTVYKDFSILLLPAAIIIAPAIAELSIL